MKKEMTNEEYLKKLGARIALLRKKSEQTQSKLSENCGLNRSYLARIESGTINTSISNLLDISKSLQVDISELVKV